ncbi:MAG: type II secretion system F family protein [Candidatus Micrarchaeota archaeon]|nr:type II secretion system F family protein [Candidatus Micrarchaeota archaeon]
MMEKTLERIQGLLYSADLNYDAREFSYQAVAFGLLLSAILWAAISLFSPPAALPVAAATFAIFIISIYALLTILASRRLAVIEDCLPDFLSIMASNIRSGLTYDRALMLAARKEFGPLSSEVDRAAKEVFTGKSLQEAMMGMTRRVKSETFSKTIRLIVEGINSGGNLAELLENTALDIRRYSAVRKEISATVLTYRIFVLAAAAIGAPLLYAVSVTLMDFSARLQAMMPSNGLLASNLPLASGHTQIAPEAIFGFSIISLSITAFFSALASGVISKGRESEGFHQLPIVLILSLAVFFGAQIALRTIFSVFFFQG